MTQKVKSKKLKVRSERGQALVMLLFFIMIGITITTAAIFIIAGNSLAASDTEMGVVTREMADSGVENALLQILRGNCANENLTMPDGNVSVTITADASCLASKITSVATSGNYTKTVVVNVSYDINRVMKVDSWKEIN